ncbi:DUF3386 domain-containing protein [Thermocoleostomius sinensis]|jgi:hypothetical protein|uniref:DUF3386 domain-containing protein n=1 Tax=Thermocoleostomius sinensis A174 TaxID=2016057 RepID=A0A9E9C667_9CYAN|nr:DUF3386 domain-containing protein [Thermocoleostomius sinensis]WAL58909.1 DUF3386 domain-containing protein [Thermocoleostomius sinensis A174]
MADQMEARELMRAAYENRYTWDKNFPGYTADVTFKRGQQTNTGKVRVNPNLSVEVLDVADEQVKQEILGQLQEIAIHRVRRSFDETHGKNTFSLGKTDETGAVEILVGGKSEGDRYKVRNNEVCMVHRHIHGVVVTINTFSSHDTGEGYLSHRYDSIYHDPKTGEQKAPQSDFEDNYQKVGDYFILTQRIICSGEEDEETTDFSFSNIKLLQPAVVS